MKLQSNTGVNYPHTDLAQNMAGDSETPTDGKPTSIPKIYVKLVKGDGLREHLGRAPTASMLLRVSVAGHAQEQVLRSKGVQASQSPHWDQEFTLKVPDPYQSQLECTIWDESDSKAKNYSNFLGEVLLNLAKLVKFRGRYIEQMFYIKQGKTIETSQDATGTIKLGLRLDMEDDWPMEGPASVEAPAAEKKVAPKEEATVQRSAPPPPSEKEAENAAARKKEEEERLAQEQAEREAQERERATETAQAEKEQAEKEQAEKEQREKEEQEKAAKEKAEKEKAQKEKAEAERVEQKKAVEKEEAEKEEADKKEAERKAREEQDLLAAEARRAQEEQEKSRKEDEDAVARAEKEAQARAKEVQEEAEQKAREELQRRREQEEEMAKKAADLMTKAPPQRTRMSTEPRNRNDARVVIAVIEAQQLTPALYECNPQAKIMVQGAASVSEAETRKLEQTKDPFWNEKFVFGIDAESIDDLSIVAHVLSGGVVVGTVADIPVKTLLGGQKMSLPTVNMGREIYCVDGWFEILPSGSAEQASQPLVTTMRSPGKSQIHLRMTYIPGSTTAGSEGPVSPSAPRVLSPQREVAASVPLARAAPPPPPPSDRVGSSPPIPAPETPSGGFANVGLMLGGGGRAGPLQVRGLVPGMPAQDSMQIQDGDALLDVDGYDVVGRDEAAVDELLRGGEGTPVTLIFQRHGRGGDPVVVTLIRALPRTAREPPLARSPPVEQVQRVSAAAPAIPSPAAYPATRASPPVKPEPQLQAAMDGPAGLKEEFKGIAFLWGEGPREDPVVPVLREWKDDILYGPPTSAETEPLPLPPGLAPPPVARDVMVPPQRLSQSMNAAPATTSTSHTVTYYSPVRATGPPLAGSSPPIRTNGGGEWSSAFA